MLFPRNIEQVSRSDLCLPTETEMFSGGSVSFRTGTLAGFGWFVSLARWTGRRIEQQESFL